MKKYAAIVLSAGSGSRMKSDIPKQYLPLIEKPVIYYSLMAFQNSPVDEIILVSGANDIEYCRKELVERYGLSKVTRIVAGGKERYYRMSISRWHQHRIESIYGWYRRHSASQELFLRRAMRY